MIYDHGPLVNMPGAGSGGHDVSTLHNDLNTFGYSDNAANGFFLADSLLVPWSQIWNIDSIIFFVYQTNSETTSSITSVNCAVWNGSPANGGTIIFGDTLTNIMTASYWSGIYRTTSTTLTNVMRPIMKTIVAPSTLWSLTTGSYWLTWQTGGSASFTGPWCPPITYPVQTISGGAMQFTATGWVPVIDTALAGTADDAPQGFPFQIYGSIITGVNNPVAN